jgi:hypothetical protein
MAANIDNHRSDEKDGSLGSSVGAAAPGGARELDERRRAALSQVDNATFSSVKNFFDPSFFIGIEIIIL